MQVYNYFRDYDAVTGRYVESDPVGLEGGLNPYLYANGNPLRYIDPYGLDSVEDVLGLDDPWVRMGRAVGAFAAYGVGKATGNELLCNVAAEELSANQEQNKEAFAIFLGTGRGGPKSGIRPLPGTRVRPSGVPENWRIPPSDSPGGTKYYDPTNRGNHVRVEQGNPSSPHPTSRDPYVRDLRNGQYRDAQGNIVPRNDPAGHIPLDQYRGYRP